MELWIRTQKHEELKSMLLKVNELEIGVYDSETKCIVVNNLHCVGIYKSEERALEVLNEIKDYMLKASFAKKKNGLGQEIDLIPNPIFIYNMPKN